MTITQSESLAATVLASKILFARFLTGFDETNATKQAVNLPNHAAWCCGHCALTMHRVAARLDNLPLPEMDFLSADGRGGNAEQFDTESISFGSQPTDEPAMYPTIARAREVYDAACDCLASAAANASDEKLAETIPWHGGDLSLGDLVRRVCFHNGTHAGQLTDLRRALGMSNVIG